MDYETDTPPPSINSVHRLGRGRIYVTSKARAWRERLRSRVYCKLSGPVSFDIRVCFRDHRKHDLDNLFKWTIDSLVFGGALDDDAQIALIKAKKCGCRKCPKAFICRIASVSGPA